jgi:hypothetical protein
VVTWGVAAPWASGCGGESGRGVSVVAEHAGDHGGGGLQITEAASILIVHDTVQHAIAATAPVDGVAPTMKIVS